MSVLNNENSVTPALDHDVHDVFLPEEKNISDNWGAEAGDE